MHPVHPSLRHLAGGQSPPRLIPLGSSGQQHLSHLSQHHHSPQSAPPPSHLMHSPHGGPPMLLTTASQLAPPPGPNHLQQHQQQQQQLQQPPQASPGRQAPPSHAHLGPPHHLAAHHSPKSLKPLQENAGYMHQSQENRPSVIESSNQPMIIECT